MFKCNNKSKNLTKISQSLFKNAFCANTRTPEFLLIAFNNGAEAAY